MYMQVQNKTLDLYIQTHWWNEGNKSGHSFYYSYIPYYPNSAKTKSKSRIGMGLVTVLECRNESSGISVLAGQMVSIQLELTCWKTQATTAAANPQRITPVTPMINVILPSAGWPRAQAFQDVKQFAREKQFVRHWVVYLQKLTRPGVHSQSAY